MSPTLTNIIELVIGLGCLIAAGGAFHRSKLLAAGLIVAGLAAVVHAIAALLGVF
jgi:hypothetical protein